MGWAKFRDRVSNRIDKETRNLDKNVNAEIKRFRNRLASSPDRAVSSINLNAASTSSSIEVGAPLDECHLQNVETLGAAANFEETANVVQLPATNICNPLHLKPGLAFVINHNTFDNSDIDERNGSQFDVQKIEEVFKRFQIPFKTVPNGTLSDVELIMAELEELNFSKYASMILVIMSHGYENDIIVAKDGHYSLYKDVLYPILRNQTLVGKPKLIFVQSCKGLTDLTLSVDSRVFRGLPTKVPDEILQFHSCVEGYCSFRHNHGSIFVQTLCEKLEEYGDTEDIREICNKVIAAVKMEFANMQIPMIHTNITKPFVLGHYKT